MLNGQNQNSNLDVLGRSKEAASNLSEAALLVMNTIHSYCYELISEGGPESIMAMANQLADEKPPKEDPRVQDFVRATESAKESALASAEAAGATSKEKAVISNYFNKLARATENAEQYKTLEVSQAPTSTPAPVAAPPVGPSTMG